LIILLQTASLLAFAQGENNIWTFGHNSGLDFNSGSPTIYVDSIKAGEGTAAVCDKSGNLLFYCDGFFAYDRSHNIMPNGSGLLGNISSTQGVAIASVPGDDSLYYLFTVDAYETWGGHKLLYNLVDMRLNGGMGDIRPAYKNVLIDSLFSEKMAIAGSCGRNWLLVHKIDSPIFYAYDLSKATPFSSPVISRSGRGGYGKLHYMVGEMKVSKNFQKIGLANLNVGYSFGSVELHDFNQKTGVVSNFKLIDSISYVTYGGSILGGRGPYTIGFSPNNKLLYYSMIEYTYASQGTFQYDISLATEAAIKASQYKVTIAPAGLKLGPDNKLYCNISKYLVPASTGVITRIANPNLLGAACNYETISLSSWPYAGSSGGTLLGNRFVPLFEINKDTNFNTINKTICEGWPLIIDGLDYDEYHWYDGDTSSRKSFTSPGTYWLRSMNNCMMNMDTFIITKQAADSSFHLKKDTLVCLGSEMIEAAPDDVDWYRWSDGDTAKTKSITSPDTIVLFTSKDNCKISFDTFKVKPIIPTYTYFKRDTLLCPLSSAVLSGRAGADKYIWYDGSTGVTKKITATSGKYWVQSQKDCAIAVDTFNVIEHPDKITTSSNSINICGTLSATLSGPAGMDRYQWNTGDTSKSINITSAGKYWLRAAKDCILYADTFNAVKKEFSTVDIQKDSSICFLPSAKITIPDKYDSYLWSGGNKGKDTTIYTDANLVFYATDHQNCEILNKQYKVSFITFKIHALDTFTCNEDTIILNADIGEQSAKYQWNTGEAGSSIKVTRPGSRIVQVSVSNCSLSDTFTVQQRILDLKIGSDTIACKGEKITLSSNIDNAVFLWSTGASNPSIEVYETGKYGLTITKDGCTAGQEIEVQLVNCSNCVALPNAFTPNDDGINDYFKPILNCPTKSYVLKILNRWGQEVFYSTTPNETWDGTAEGKTLEGNVFYFMLKVSFEAQGEEEQIFKGDITLIR
jgi:gliding motility-associated-like protein